MKALNKNEIRTAPHSSKKFKQSIPAPSPYLIKRESIIGRVEGDSYARLVLLCAPAGFGKTTAMLQLHHLFNSRGGITAWLSLDSRDNDVARFLDRFASALSHIPHYKGHLFNDGHHYSDIAQRLSSVVANCEEPLTIFFDGFETLNNPVVLSLIVRGIGVLPEGGKMIIGSRTLPDLELSGLKVKGHLIEFDAKDLRFSEREVEEFLNGIKKLNLTKCQLQHLYSVTEGWPAAVWLTSFSLSRRKDLGTFIENLSGSNEEIGAYLAEDVLSGLSEDSRRFLLSISILEELEAGICEALTGFSDSHKMLESFYKKNIFIRPVAGKNHVYKFHPLFRSFLIDQLRLGSKDQFERQNLRASEIYLTEGRWEKAISHALVCKKKDYATKLLKQYSGDLLKGGRISLLAEYLSLLPVSEILRDYDLSISYAWCLVFTKGAEETLVFIDRVDQDGLPDELLSQFKALQAMLLALKDCISEAQSCAEQVLKLEVERYPFSAFMVYQILAQTSIILGLHEQAKKYIDIVRERQYQAIGNTGFLLAESAESILDLMHGQLRQSAIRLRLATRRFLSDRSKHRRGVVLSAIGLAETLYENDKFDEAKYLLDAYCPLVKDVGPPDTLISAYVIRARISMAEGDHNEALELLIELEVVGHKLKLTRVVASARLERSNVYIAMGDMTGAKEQMRQASAIYDCRGMRDRWYIANDTLYSEMISFRLMVRSGKAAEAIPLICKEIEEAEAEMRLRRAFELRFLLAEARWRHGMSVEAMRAISGIVDMCETQGFNRLLREESELVSAVKNKTAEDRVEVSQGLKRAWSITEDKVISSQSLQVLPHKLTKKEMEVLRLAAEGLSNQNIAEFLFISESTVRTHLRNINAKLETRSRSEAVAVMRKQGLFI